MALPPRFHRFVRPRQPGRHRHGSMGRLGSRYTGVSPAGASVAVFDLPGRTNPPDGVSPAGCLCPATRWASPAARRRCGDLAGRLFRRRHHPDQQRRARIAGRLTPEPAASRAANPPGMRCSSPTSKRADIDRSSVFRPRTIRQHRQRAPCTSDSCWRDPPCMTTVVATAAILQAVGYGVAKSGVLNFTRWLASARRSASA